MNLFQRKEGDVATLLSLLAIFATFIDEQTTQRVANRVVIRARYQTRIAHPLSRNFHRGEYSYPIRCEARDLND
jgi:hypothetical protein